MASTELAAYGARLWYVAKDVFTSLAGLSLSVGYMAVSTIMDHPTTAVTEGSVKSVIYHSQQHIYFRGCRSNLACCFLALISGDLPSPRTALHPTQFRCYPVFAFRSVTSFLFCRTVSGRSMPVALKNKPGGFLSSRALSARSRAMMRTPESKKW